MDAKKKEPLLRVVKHAELSRAQSIGLRILAVALALVVGGVFIAAIGYNPFEIYGTIISGCFRSPMAFQATVKFCIPMCISALGVTLAFKMRFWNIGGEGQLIMGAVFASFFALFFSGMPHFLLLAVMFVAGFVGGWFMKVLRKGCDKLPRPLEGIKPVLIYPVVGLLFIGLLMSLINPIMGVINSAISNGLTALESSGLAILLGALVAGMMAIDMGGPFNKAAYVFGTATIGMAASGFSPVMAAVMIGGMVPPISIALATTFFKNRFTSEERKSGPVNYIMGLCFITEGAIPFAASDPLRVIPSCIVGSAVAGALSMAFGCASPAPHGGIFVFPVMQNIPGYLIALVIGSLVGMLMLALLKKKKVED